MPPSMVSNTGAGSPAHGAVNNMNGRIAWKTRRILPGLDMPIVHALALEPSGRILSCDQHEYLGLLDFDGRNCNVVLFTSAPTTSAAHAEASRVTAVRCWGFRPPPRGRLPRMSVMRSALDVSAARPRVMLGVCMDLAFSDRLFGDGGMYRIS